jgi:hypothetical protein
MFGPIPCRELIVRIILATQQIRPLAGEESQHYLDRLLPAVADVTEERIVEYVKQARGLANLPYDPVTEQAQREAYVEANKPPQLGEQEREIAWRRFLLGGQLA